MPEGLPSPRFRWSSFIGAGSVLAALFLISCAPIEPVPDRYPRSYPPSSYPDPRYGYDPYCCDRYPPGPPAVIYRDHYYYDRYPYPAPHYSSRPPYSYSHPPSSPPPGYRPPPDRPKPPDRPSDRNPRIWGNFPIDGQRPAPPRPGREGPSFIPPASPPAPMGGVIRPPPPMTGPMGGPVDQPGPAMRPSAPDTAKPPRGREASKDRIWGRPQDARRSED